MAIIRKEKRRVCPRSFCFVMTMRKLNLKFEPASVLCAPDNYLEEEKPSRSMFVNNFRYIGVSPCTKDIGSSHTAFAEL